MLRGEPGIGKTTLWEAGLALAGEGGLRVLVARPSDAESEHAFAGLIDLCEGLDLDGLPTPQRSALEVALLRREPDGPAPEPHAIGLALRGALAAAAPVLVAIDDVQSLDAPSAEALAFAARRLVDAPVGFLLTGRGASPLEQALVDRSLTTLELGPLAAGDLRGVVADRLGVELPVAALQRITAATLGNPRFALRLARSSGERLPVLAAEEELLGVRVAELPDEERHLLLAVGARRQTCGWRRWRRSASTCARRCDPGCSRSTATGCAPGTRCSPPRRSRTRFPSERRGGPRSAGGRRRRPGAVRAPSRLATEGDDEDAGRARLGGGRSTRRHAARDRRRSRSASRRCA